MRSIGAFVVGTMIAACSPPPKPSPVPTPTAVGETADASAAPAPTPAETVTDAAPPSTSAMDAVPEACRSTAATPLDLGSAMAADACRADLGDAGTIPALPSGVSVRVEPAALSVASGHYLVFYVVLENKGTSPAEVVLERELSFGGWGESIGELGHGAGTGLGSIGTASRGGQHAKRKPSPPPVPMPKEQPTPGFSVGSAFDAKGRSTAFPMQSYGMIGLLGGAPKPEAMHFVLGPSTQAKGTVVWQANGYDPSKNYLPKQKHANPNEGFMVPPPEPLKPGKYRLGIELPAKQASGEDLSTSAEVDVTR